jgi:predicted MFS family arabinose efflux permease
LFAFFFYGFGASQALLRDEQGTTRTISGLHATVYAIANVISALVLPSLITRFSRNAVLRAGIIGMCIGLAVYTGPGGLAASLTGIAIISFFGCAIIVTSNAFVLDYQKGAGPAALTQANALAALVGLLGPLTIGIGAATILGWRFGLWMLIVALLISELLRRRYADAYRAPTVVHDLEVHLGPLPRAFYWSISSVAMFMAAEFALSLWSADLLRDRGSLGAAAAAASVAAVTGGLLVGRTVGSRVAERIPIDRILKGSILIGLVGFLLAWATMNPAVIILGLFFSGVGLAVSWPLGVARAVRTSGGRTDIASGRATAAGALAGGVSPFVLGALADQFNVHLAFLIVPAMLVGVFVILTISPLREP